MAGRPQNHFGQPDRGGFLAKHPLCDFDDAGRRSAISDDLYEAGKIDGANGWQLFRHITLPLLRGSLMICILVPDYRLPEGIRSYQPDDAGGPEMFPPPSITTPTAWPSPIQISATPPLWVCLAAEDDPFGCGIVEDF